MKQKQQRTGPTADEHAAKVALIATAGVLMDQEGFATGKLSSVSRDTLRQLPTSDTVHISSLMPADLQEALLHKPGFMGGYVFSGSFDRSIALMRPVQRLRLDMGFTGTISNLRACSTLVSLSLSRDHDDLRFRPAILNELPDSIKTIALHNCWQPPLKWPASLTDVTISGDGPRLVQHMYGSLAATQVQKLRISADSTLFMTNPLPPTVTFLEIKALGGGGVHFSRTAQLHSALQHLDLRNAWLCSRLPLFPHLHTLLLSESYDYMITQPDFPSLTHITVSDQYEDTDTLGFCANVTIRID